MFNLLERRNVIDGTGQINVKTLRNTLDSKASGFGRTATAGGETTNPETRRLIDLIQAADRPEFKAFSSSGTAENLQLGRTLDDLGAAASDLVQGDPRRALGAGGKLMAPGVISTSQLGGGAMFEGIVNPSVGGQLIGSGVGRSALDEALYPFVGVEDERIPRQ